MSDPRTNEQLLWQLDNYNTPDRTMNTIRCVVDSKVLTNQKETP